MRIYVEKVKNKATLAPHTHNNYVQRYLFIYLM